MKAFDDAGVDMGTLGLFKMRQDDSCVNDLSPRFVSNKSANKK